MGNKKFRFDKANQERLVSAFEKLENTLLKDVSESVIGGARVHGQTFSEAGGHGQTHSQTGGHGQSHGQSATVEGGN